VEAKAAYKHPADGLQQAKDYATILGLPFAYATNGISIVEFDFLTGRECELTAFPTPAALWARFRQGEQLNDAAVIDRFLTPFNLTTGKTPHYYQRIAIQRIIKAILKGQRRVLVTMATGTGKTVVAFHLCWKLWSSRWNRTLTPGTSALSLQPSAFRKPRILYLADRNFLVDDPKDKTFAPFGDARYKIEGGVTVFSRELYFATYQSIARDQRRPGLYREFPRDFFDLVIVDECHRGSAREESNWREILEWFEPAYQLGMTATPLREENKDTYLHFGNPVYTYSLKQGINDGFLAPYRVLSWPCCAFVIVWRPADMMFRSRMCDGGLGGRWAISSPCIVRCSTRCTFSTTPPTRRV
jgi:type I restriction enzyme, R subunit